MPILRFKLCMLSRVNWAEPYRDWQGTQWLSKIHPNTTLYVVVPVSKLPIHLLLLKYQYSHFIHYKSSYRIYKIMYNIFICQSDRNNPLPLEPLNIVFPIHMNYCCLLWSWCLLLSPNSPLSSINSVLSVTW